MVAINLKKLIYINLKQMYSISYNLFPIWSFYSKITLFHYFEICCYVKIPNFKFFFKSDCFVDSVNVWAPFWNCLVNELAEKAIVSSLTLLIIYYLYAINKINMMYIIYHIIYIVYFITFNIVGCIYVHFNS